MTDAPPDDAAPADDAAPNADVVLDESDEPAAPVTADVPEDAAHIVAVEAEPDAPQDDPVIYGVLLQPRGGLVAGQIVYAPTSTITAAIAAEAVRLPDAGQVARAEPFHYPLPPANPPA